MAGKKMLGMMVGEAKDPEVFRADCCGNQQGILVRINGAWWLLRDAAGRPGKLMTAAFKVAICRGCYQDITDATPVKPWTWDRDGQIDEHLRQIARQTAPTAAEPKEAAKE